MNSTGHSIGADELVRRLGAAVSAGDAATITSRVKSELEGVLQSRGLQLPDRFRQTRPDRYARRLLHRDAALGYTVLVMAWAPGQRTPIHDHAGIWSVEGVIEGVIEVTQYALLKELAGRYRFAPVDRGRATVGSSDCLIPPFEYHVLANDLTGRPALTIHVHGGELRELNAFEMGPDGWYERQSRRLFYDD
jgi:predicted metal-dependent enzyme (double-stranded beta helix superfamily)